MDNIFIDKQPLIEDKTIRGKMTKQYTSCASYVCAHVPFSNIFLYTVIIDVSSNTHLIYIS